MRVFLAIISFAILVPNVALAKRVGGLFGKREQIKKIQDVPIQGPNGEELFLAYKTTSLFVILGVYHKDDGYVLGVKGSFGTYYPLDEEMIKSYQESGSLPNPMPEYEIPLFDRLFGFSLWILLVVLVIVWFSPLKTKATNFEKGCKYYFGKDVPVDYAKAHTYFVKSAEKGFAPGQYNLGVMYLNGQGVTKDIEKAISYFMLASDQNYVNAQFQLGNIYFNGKEIAKNEERAVSFYTAACKNGDTEACKMVEHIKRSANPQ